MDVFTFRDQLVRACFQMNRKIRRILAHPGSNQQGHGITSCADRRSVGDTSPAAAPRETHHCGSAGNESPPDFERDPLVVSNRLALA